MNSFSKNILINLIKLVIALIVFIHPSNALAQKGSAVFAGGCFWCLEHDFENIKGVISVESGYTGGELTNPSYRNHEGHQEAVIVHYDPTEISYPKLLRNFWRNIDPLDAEGQFCDKGDAYRPIIFASDKQQKDYALQSIELASKELNLSQTKIMVEIKPLNQFWLAEEYHQDFAKNNSFQYNFYRYRCGRDNRLDELWGDSARTGKGWKSRSEP